MDLKPVVDDRKRDAVLRNFMRDGQIVALPVKAGKRRILLEHVVRAFEPGVKMTEYEVNVVLRAFYAKDWVSLRRYLIDAGLLTREKGVYWRTGGYVDL